MAILSTTAPTTPLRQRIQHDMVLRGLRASERAVAVTETNPATPDVERAVCMAAHGTFLCYLAKQRDGLADLRLRGMGLALNHRS